MNRLARLLLPPGGATPARVLAWTLVSGALYAGESFLVLVAATHLAGAWWGGVVGLAFAVDQLLFTVGAFSVRRYQASDAAERVPFPVYCGARALTCGAMVLAGLAWAAFGDFTPDKRAAILPLLAFKASEAFSDVLGGRYQQRGRLDAAGRILAAKTLLSAAAFAAALALGARPPAALWAMAAAHLALTALLDGAVLPAFGGLRLRLPTRPAAALLFACSPLAATAFLQMFVNNVPKFAVDAATDETTMAAFSALAMASFVLVVLADLLSAPHVERLGRAREAGDWSAFPCAAFALSAAALVLGATACAGAWLFGIPVLSALFGLDLAAYRAELCLLVLSGTLLALHLVADVVLVVLRRQAWCLVSALLAAAVAAATARPFVEARGVLGAAICHLAAAAVLFLANAAVAAFFLRRAARSARVRAADGPGPAPDPSRPLCVLVVHNRYRVRGGEDGVFETECRLLEEAGHRVIRYEKSNDSIEFDRFAGPQVPSSQVRPANLRTCEPANRSGAARKLRAVGAKLALALRTIWNGRTYREIREIIRREKPDVIHCHNTFPLISPSIYWAASREGVPVVQTLHNYRLACLNGYLFRDGHVCEKCLGRSPWRGVCRRCYRDSRGQSAVAAAMLLVHRLLGTYRRKVTRYIALTDFAKAKFVEAGLPARKISVKPNAFAAAGGKRVGLPATVVSPGSRANDAIRVVYVGRLSPEKGVDVLIRALALLQAPGGPGAAEPRHGPALTCEIVGDGPERAALEGLAGDLGLSDSVHFLGALPRDAALAELSSASLLVLPSLCYEQFAITPLEAMALGVPALVSDVARAGTMVEDGVTGRFFRAGDPAALAAALRELLSDPAALRRMGAAARAAFEASDCRPDRNLARLLAVYASARSAHDA